MTTADDMTHEERLLIYLSTNPMLPQLPPAPKAAANYCPCQRSGDLLFLSGHLPFSSVTASSTSIDDGTTATTLAPYIGRLGHPSSSSTATATETTTASSLQNDDDNANINEKVMVQEVDPVILGYNAARQAGLNLIATIRAELGGSINDVDQIVKLFGLVQSHDDFHQQHLVMNGCSDVMTNVFGPIAGKHARSAVGTNALPLNSMIEIEAIVRIKNK